MLSAGGRIGGAVAGVGDRVMSTSVAQHSRPMLIVILGAVFALLAGLSVLAADAAGGGNLVLLDAGPIARHGAPVAATLADLAAALTLGGAVIAGWLLRDEADRARVLIVVGVAAAITTLARGASSPSPMRSRPGSPSARRASGPISVSSSPPIWGSGC